MLYLKFRTFEKWIPYFGCLGQGHDLAQDLLLDQLHQIHFLSFRRWVTSTTLDEWPFATYFSFIPPLSPRVNNDSTRSLHFTHKTTRAIVMLVMSDVTCLAIYRPEEIRFVWTILFSYPLHVIQPSIYCDFSHLDLQSSNKINCFSNGPRSRISEGLIPIVLC